MCVVVVVVHAVDRFTRSLNRPGQLTMSPPYLDAFGAGYVVTLSTTIHQSSVR